MSPSPTLGNRAVVLGASMAGLFAARVLSEAYAHVAIVDRDVLPDDDAPRRGVPQGRHLHALLARGQQVLEELFPGLTADLVAQGAPTGDMLANTRWYVSGYRLRQTVSGLLGVGIARPRLERHVRVRVAALAGVEIVQGCDIVGLTATPDGRRITGARLRRRGNGTAQEVLGADLVVDATGRGSGTPLWLEALGYRRPAEERVPIGLGYATRSYRLPPGALGSDVGILPAPTPERPRGAGLALIGPDRCTLTLAGVLGDHPPTDPDGFLAFARSLRCADVYDIIRDAEPLDDPVAFRFPASVRLRYERLPRLPQGLLAIGDGVCSFNPLYGQGMSVAALEALALREHLRHGREPNPRRFVRDVARVVDPPWKIVVGGDLAFPGVQGRRTPAVRLLNAYVPRLHAAGADDARLARAFVRVAGLVDPPRSLLRPRVVGGVLRHSLRRRARARRDPCG